MNETEQDGLDAAVKLAEDLQRELDKVRRERNELRADIRDLHENNLIVYSPGSANKDWWDKDGLLNALEKSDARMHCGEKGVRDPDSICELYDPGLPKRDARCDGDGHYLCQACAWMPDAKRRELRGEQ